VGEVRWRKRQPVEAGRGGGEGQPGGAVVRGTNRGRHGLGRRRRDSQGRGSWILREKSELERIVLHAPMLIHGSWDHSL
jgi:hypothetical protein